MGAIETTTYGLGGYASAKPDGNVVERGTATTSPEQDTADTLRSRAQAALAANATFLALATPTAAQNAAQVQRLTKECSALIRLLLGLLDDVTGT